MSDTTRAVSSGMEVPCGTMAGTTEKRPSGGVCDNTGNPLGLATTPNCEGDVVTDSYSATDFGSDPTSLYLYYDSNDLLLYVGITKRGMSRNREHNATQEWWPFVARQEVEHFRSRGAALIAEKETIRRLYPPFNKHHNPEYHAMRQAYLDLRASGKLPNRKKAHQELRWIPLNFVDYDGNRFLYNSGQAFAQYVKMLNQDAYRLTCSLKKGRARVTREDGILWATIRGQSGRISAPRLRVSPVGGSKMRSFTVKALDLIGDGRAHPTAIKWSAENMKPRATRPECECRKSPPSDPLASCACPYGRRPDAKRRGNYRYTEGGESDQLVQG